MTDRLEPTLRVRINQIDHTLAQPGPLDKSSLPRVPIIRIYGVSSTGKKACLHVHQVYPYFFVEYNGNVKPDSVNRHITRLSRSLNHAIAISLKRNPHSAKSQFVRAVLLVKGVHFYGFHSSYSPFLKIMITDPAYVNRAVTIMQSGTVMQTRFRVYESHLSYLLQFMCDFGLYGCGWIDLGEVWIRGSDVEDEDRDDSFHAPTDATAFNISPYFRQSRMPLELDVAAHQILNRHLLAARNIHHKLNMPAPPLPTEPLVLSVRELWDDERRQRIANGLAPSPELPVDPSEKSRGKGGEWVAEARWWEEVRRRIERESTKEVQVKEGDESWEKWVMTTFESVEALWDEEWKAWKPGGNVGHKVRKDEDQQTVENPFSSAGSLVTWNQRNADTEQVAGDVDEAMLSSQEMSQLVEREEAEWENFIGEMDGEDDLENEDGGYEDEDPLEAEDGPPPGLQSADDPTSGHTDDEQSTESLSDPFADTPSRSHRKRPNPFQDAFLELAVPGRTRASSVASSGPGTPTKSKTMVKRKAVPSSPSFSKYSPPIPTMPATHVLEETKWHQEPIAYARPLLRSQLPAASSSPNFDDRDQAKLPDLADSSPARLAPNDTVSDLPLSIYHLPHAIGADFQTESTLPLEEHNPTTAAETAGDDIRLAKKRKLNYSGEPASMQTSISSSFQSQGRGATFAKESFTSSSPENCLVYSLAPPTTSELIASIEDHGIPSQIYRAPFYSKEVDAPERPREYAGLLYYLRGGEGVSTLDEWETSDTKSNGKYSETFEARSLAIGGWEYASTPPNVREVKIWLSTDAGRRPLMQQPSNQRSQIMRPTQANIYGSANTPIAPSAPPQTQGMTVLACEVFAPSREDRVPDPDTDEIVAVFYSFQEADHVDAGIASQSGLVVVENSQLHSRRLRDFDMEVASGELDLLNKFVDIVVDLDPDIIVGWEVQAASWGYLNVRGRHYGFDIGDLISRAPARHPGSGVDQWGARQTSTFKVVGRHVLNLWRIMRVEQSLNMYTFENVAFHLLRKRVARYSHLTLTEWYNSPVPAHTARTLRYFSDRTAIDLEILEEAEVVTKNAEFARVFGVDFFSVISRGSQFKVESFMFRIAKPESFVLLSPSKHDVGRQNAAECMPLIMEPLAAFYTSPLVVLDFQSLYPSVMIAYNYCYSTCLGRITDFKGQNKLGVSALELPPGLLGTLRDHIHVAPNGIMYVKPDVRRGLLSRMLTELLETRVMVKQAMKGVKADKARRRILDARQLSLKYICNVTYGYTGATYSGRMPAVEIADSIVQSGRETLEKAIHIIDSTRKWGAKVVYGDTDSLFIYLKGKTKEQAFRIGYDMADTITALNPAPIKLKFEKVYLPCILMAKKRYVGFKYEAPDDKDPTFDAKGIETVRRDGIPAQKKMTENCLKILFRTQDLSQVKAYCSQTWLQILEHRVSVQDFIFAKEVKMGTYSDKGPPPPGVTVAARRIMQDHNDEPQYGERVPYVIVRGDPHTRLVDRAMEPQQLLDKRQNQLDSGYYISRVLIPPLERIFNLVGADVRSWYDDMPKTLRADQPDTISFSPSKANKNENSPDRFKIDEHFHSSQCLVCGTLTPEGVCEACHSSPQITIASLLRRLHTNEDRLLETHRICASCTSSGLADPIKCESLDCSWFFERRKAEQKVEYSMHELLVRMDAEESTS